LTEQVPAEARNIIWRAFTSNNGDYVIYLCIESYL
jgi:hypothetical protein